jgi:hypothetical protein
MKNFSFTFFLVLLISPLVFAQVKLDTNTPKGKTDIVGSKQNNESTVGIVLVQLSQKLK